MISLQIDQDELQRAVHQSIVALDLIPKDELIGKTIGIDDFRRRYCGGKSASWVRTNVFDEYPEVDFANGGWVIAPHQTAGVKKTIIFEHQAAHWMENHRQEIDWMAK